MIVSSPSDAVSKMWIPALSLLTYPIFDNSTPYRRTDPLASILVDEYLVYSWTIQW